MARVLGVHARVWADLADLDENDERSGDWIASVRLDTGAPFALAFPLNEPLGSDVVWPTGSTLKAQGIEEHSSETSKILENAYFPGACSIFVRLEPTEIEPGKKGVGLFYEGLRLGQLSQASGNKFLPVLMKVREGASVLGLATLEGNSVAAQMSVSLLSPEKLTETELKMLGL